MPKQDGEHRVCAACRVPKLWPGLLRVLRCDAVLCRAALRWKSPHVTWRLLVPPLQAISKSLGAYFIDAAGIRAEVPCDFSNFGTVLTVGHMILPLLAMPLTFFMIPNARLTDNLSQVSFWTGGKRNQTSHTKHKQSNGSPLPVVFLPFL